MATVGNLVVGIIAKTAQFERAMDRVSRRTDRISRKFRSVGDDLTVGLTLPLVAAGVAATRMAVKFDDSLTQIISLVGVSRNQVNAWRGDLLKLSGEVGRGPVELADALFFVTSAGLRGSAAIEVLTASAQAAAAGMGETKVVADAVTSALNSYGTANLSAAKATGILVATVREGKVAAASLAPVLGRILPIAAELEVSFDQVGAALAFLTRLSGSATQAATGLRGILAKIVKPTEAGEKALRAVGLSMDEIRRSLVEKGLLATLVKLRTTFGDNTKALGKIFEDIEALNAVLALTGKSVDKAEEIFASLAKTTGDDLTKAFEAASQSAGFKMRQAMSQLQAVMIIFGDQILPVVVPLVAQLAGALGTGARAFLALTAQQRAAALGMVAFAAAAGPVLSIVGRLGRGVALLLSPFAIAGVLIAGAALLIASRWEKLKESMIVIYQALGQGAIDMAKATIGAMNPFIGTLFQASATLDILSGNLRRSTAGAFGAAAGAATAFGDEIRLQFGTAAADVRDFVLSMIEGLPLGGESMLDLANKSIEASDIMKQALATLNASLAETNAKALQIPSAFARIKDESVRLRAGTVPAINQVKSSIAALQNQGASAIGALSAQFLRGQVTARQFVQSVIVDLSRLLVKILVLRAVGGGLLGIFAGEVAGAAIPQKQFGGRASAGRSVLVGERGPELFTPDTAGNILPSTAVEGMQSRGGGGTTIEQLNITVQAGGDLTDPTVMRTVAENLAEFLDQETEEGDRLAGRMRDRGEITAEVAT